MFSGSLIFVLIIIFLIIFIFYKREMLLKVFSLNVASSANQFQEQLEEVADGVIQRLEERISYLEDVLETVDAKIISLDEKMKAANKILEKETKDMIEVSVQSITDSSGIQREDATEIDGKLDYIAIPIKESNTLGIDNYKEIARKNKRDSVLALADQGYNSIEIAKITGISKSEIILLLQLNKR
jgi:nitrogen fixation/metabolism regulation signal transduction histidine kinase